MVSLVGGLRLSRPYYRCPHCKQSQLPWDERLQLGSRATTPAATQLISLAGTLSSFGEAADRTLTKLSGIRVSEATVQRTTEDAGRRLAKRQAERSSLHAYQPWQWRRDASGRRVGYISIDHTGVRRQALGGGKAEGHMAAVAMVYNPPPSDGAQTNRFRKVRYLAGFLDFDEIGRQLQRESTQVGWHHCEQQIALTDGGNGLEPLIERHFPRAQCILDFFHASEHVAELARAVHPSDETACEELMKQWCGLLKSGGGQALLDEWRRLELDQAPEPIRQTYHDQSRYLRKNLHRTDYPSYLSNGWQIGSGPIEAACKTVIGQRLKCSGMRWGDDGADSVSHLRALYLSEPTCWETFWSKSPN